MTTLYISQSDFVYVRTSGEWYTLGIGWTFAANQVSIEEWQDVVIGDTRAASASDITTLAESVTVYRADPGLFLNRDIPTRRISASGYYDSAGGPFLKIPVRGLSASTGSVLSKKIPTRSSTGEVGQTYGATLSKRIPVRVLESYAGAELALSKIPVRSITAAGYTQGARLSKSIPVRTITAAFEAVVYMTLTGYVSPRSISASGYGEYFGTLDKKRPIHTGVISALQDYGITLDKTIPIRTLEAAVYESNMYLDKDRPVWVAGASVDGGSESGSGGSGSGEVTDEYILRYTRP